MEEVVDRWMLPSLGRVKINTDVATENETGTGLGTSLIITWGMCFSALQSPLKLSYQLIQVRRLQQGGCGDGGSEGGT